MKEEEELDEAEVKNIIEQQEFEKFKRLQDMKQKNKLDQILNKESDLRDLNFVEKSRIGKKSKINFRTHFAQALGIKTLPASSKSSLGQLLDKSQMQTSKGGYIFKKN